MFINIITIISFHAVEKILLCKISLNLLNNSYGAALQDEGWLDPKTTLSKLAVKASVTMISTEVSHGRMI